MACETPRASRSLLRAFSEAMEAANRRLGIRARSTPQVWVLSRRKRSLTIDRGRCSTQAMVFGIVRVVHATLISSRAISTVRRFMMSVSGVVARKREVQKTAIVARKSKICSTGLENHNRSLDSKRFQTHVSRSHQRIEEIHKLN